METNGIVLAGGKSLRLGQNKLFEVIGGQLLLERVVSRLSFLKSDVVIVKSAGQSIPPTGYVNIRVVTDIFPGRGPLGGIYTGLAASETSHSLVVAGDMPFLKRELLEYMIALSADYDLVIPRTDSLVEPLHAVYSRACLKPITELLDSGKLRIRKLFERVRVKYIESKEIDRFDPEHLSFFNINTPADLEKAAKLAGEEIHR